MSTFFLTRARGGSDIVDNGMDTSRSKYSKALRKIKLERLICSTILERLAFPGSVELAEELDVTPRTIRNYFKERTQKLCGPEKIWLYFVDEQGREIGRPELLTFEECARKTNQSVRELRRQIWMERRDRIAAVRAAYEGTERSTTRQKDEQQASG